MKSSPNGEGVAAKIERLISTEGLPALDTLKEVLNLPDRQESVSTSTPA